MAARVFSPARRATAERAGPSESEAPKSEPTGPKSEAAFRHGREAAALLLFAVASFLCLALSSHRTDPSDPPVSGADWVGPVGASVAAILVRAFGLVAWLAPVELALVGVPLLRGRAIGSVSLRIA